MKKINYGRIGTILTAVGGSLSIIAGFATNIQSSIDMERKIAEEVARQINK